MEINGNVRAIEGIARFTVNLDVKVNAISENDAKLIVSQTIKRGSTGEICGLSEIERNTLSNIKKCIPQGKAVFVENN